jgi:spore germination cell wall hydrolase CwlJ-like protein
MQGIKHVLLVCFCLLFLLHPKSLSDTGPAVPGVFIDQNSSCEATALWYEARGENVLAQQMVLQVVRNRARIAETTSCEVIKKPHQFSWMRHHPKIGLDEERLALLDKAQRLQVPRNENVLFFFSGHRPGWARKMLCEKMGKLNFCKEKK